MHAVGAAAVLGRSVEVDDLTAVEGIGPQIAELCHGIGIRTWAELSVTEVSLLRTMLNDAGQRFKAHDPSTWPRQAGLLASGDWAEFAALTGGADGERPVD
jgi:predicted flap endonuclease-1-like 5' DNA nuclease